MWFPFYFSIRNVEIFDESRNLGLFFFTRWICLSSILHFLYLSFSKHGSTARISSLDRLYLNRGRFLRIRGTIFRLCLVCLIPVYHYLS